MRVSEKYDRQPKRPLIPQFWGTSRNISPPELGAGGLIRTVLTVDISEFDLCTLA